MKAARIHVAFAAVLAAGAAHADNLLLNGSFELPAGTTYASLPTGSITISGWTTVLNGAAWFNANALGGAAADGVMLVDLTRYIVAGGGIEQTFATEAGTSYDLEFNLSTMLRNGRDGTAHVDVKVGTLTTGYDVTNLTANLVWTPYTQRFTATGPTTTIRFTNTENGSLNYAFLDKVSVTEVLPQATIQAVPEPETYAMMLVGLGLLGMAQRMRSSSTGR